MAWVTEPKLASFDGGAVYATLRYDDVTLACSHLIVEVPYGIMAISVTNKRNGRTFGPEVFTETGVHALPANLDLERDNLGRLPTATLSVSVGWSSLDPSGLV